MSRLNKSLACFTVLALAFIMGCGAVTNVSSNSYKIRPTTHKFMGKATYKPVKITYALDNPIDITNINVSNSTEHQRSYFEIDGLVNEDVEDSINKAIKSLFDEMIPYATGEKRPPYRGIEKAIQEDKVISSSAILVEPQFNSNNILSVVANVSGIYNHPTDGQVYFSLSETLNFDLNSGKKFSIQDVFTNDVNGLDIVNEAILNEIERRSIGTDIDYNPYANFTLAAPFKGINHAQKFYLGPDGLNVIIDYQNPEFDVGFSYTTVVVPYYSSEGHIAITERFYDETKSIFTKEAKEKRFFRNFDLNTKKQDSFYKNGTEWRVTVRLPEDLPPVLMKIVNALRSKQEEEIALSQKSPILHAEQNIYAHRIGPYINISSHINTSTKDENQWAESSYVYSDSGQPIKLEDLFVGGYDYKNTLKDAINRYAKESGFPQAPNPNMLLENLFFKINETSISFITMPFEWSPGNKHPLYFDVSYEEIGFKNLKIF